MPIPPASLKFYSSSELQSEMHHRELLDRGFSVSVSPYYIHENHFPFVPEILFVFSGILPLFKDSSLLD